MQDSRVVPTAYAYAPVANGPNCIPVYYPVATFVTVQPMVVPQQWQGVIPGQLWGILSAANSLTVRQHVKILPKACCACPPCARQENTYSVYAGLNQQDEAEILRVDEISDDWNRCCCAPSHPFRLEVRPYIPVPGDSSNSDYGHISQDIRSDFAGWDARRKVVYMNDLYKASPPMFTAIRNDGQRCCALPCKCLNCFVCAGCCQDGAHVYAGSLEDDPRERGRPRASADSSSKLVGSIEQPCCGGGCHPSLHLRGSDDKAEPYGKIVGPCCFGGWSECCFNFKFYTSRFRSGSHAGDLGVITKKKPSSLAGAARELLTNADVFTITFKDDAKLTEAEKVTILTGQLLIDYMIFDGKTEKCHADDQGITCYFWYCSIYGAICPCCIHIPKAQ